jgi:hypothetical protein
MITQTIIPLCDKPAKGQSKAVPFSANWYEFQNLFKLLSNGAIICHETQQTDPTGQKVEAYYFAAMQALTDPRRPPVYISFTTRGWTPPATPAQPKPTEIVLETWHGLAELNSEFDPATGVDETQDGRLDVPPPTAPPDSTRSAPSTEIAAPHHEMSMSLEDEVMMLVEAAIFDPEGATKDGAVASSRLEELAWAAGATKQQTAAAKDWSEVAEMALGIFPTEPPTLTNGSDPTVGSHWNFCKRTKDGAKLRNGKNEEFPPQEVEVTSVDASAKTCTVKTVRDGKDVVDIRSKQPVSVKFEWLEAK